MSYCSEDCCGCWLCSFDNDYDDNKCSCGSEGSDPHTCPFAEEINGNYERLCNCCNSCTYECAQDI